MDDRTIRKHVYIFNPDDNGGEQLLLVTRYWDNGDRDAEPYVTQELSLSSYCNAATFDLQGATLTPTNLRELANQLESEGVQAKLDRRTEDG